MYLDEDSDLSSSNTWANKSIQDDNNDYFKRVFFWRIILHKTAHGNPIQNLFPCGNSPWHAEKSFRNLIISYRNQIVFTIFRLIWNQTDVRLLFQINQKMVDTIWFRVDLIKFRKYFSVCTTLFILQSSYCIIKTLKSIIDIPFSLLDGDARWNRLEALFSPPFGGQGGLNNCFDEQDG